MSEDGQTGEGLSFRPGGKLLREQIRENSPAIVEKVAQKVSLSGIDINPLILDTFRDSYFIKALPSEIQTNEDLLAEYLTHSSKFSDVIHHPGLYGELVKIPSSQHADGRTRREESGLRINLDYLRSNDIDPNKVLFFRITQPSPTPKPEYYWTSDYYETLRGLTIEIPPEKRQTAVILVSTLEEINSRGGLIADINDDQGLAVRQISLNPFDQTKAIGKIEHPLVRNVTKSPEEPKSSHEII